MECNRDEAARAKEIAESKFRGKDVEGAKRMVLKAEALYPGLEGIPQMIATLDVYLAAERLINGEKDWYSILCVTTSADDETVKKQYRRLALLLHPDKNKSVGAEGAFKLVSEAWSVLSDKTRRLAYDKKRNIKVYKHRPPPPPPPSNGVFQFSKSAAVRAPPPPPPPPVVPHPNTFWTVCNRCKMQYEYLRVYLNHNLLCPNCHEPFLAVEIPIPTNGRSSSNIWATQQSSAGKASRKASSATSFSGTRSNGFHHGSSCDPPRSGQGFQWGAFPPSAAAAAAAAAPGSAGCSFSGSTQTINAVFQAYEMAEQRKKQAAFDSTSCSFDKPSKKRRSPADDSGVVRVDESNAAAVAAHEAESGKTRVAAARQGGREFLLQSDIRSMLLQKGKSMVQKKLEELRSAAKPKQRRKEKETETPPAPVEQEEEEKTVEEAEEGKAAAGSTEEPSSPEAAISINVPDADFHDFDSDRSEQCLRADQVWASYDDEDGMPRFYVLVQKVLSLKPFKVRLSFLNSKSTAEFGSLNWVGSGFAKTCGDFRIGRYEVHDTVNIFSHPVRYEKGPRGAIRIVPRRGDIWALYRNWSPEWDEHTPEEVIYRYDMVEVLEDFSDEGVLVAHLAKVSGFKTVFRRRRGEDAAAPARRIPKEETFRFSHQVPCYTLSGEEAENAPKGCFELDPAATPLELLQVDGENEAAAAPPPPAGVS